MRRWLQGLGLLLAAESADAQVVSKRVDITHAAASAPAVDEARAAFTRGAQLFLAGDSSAAAAEFARAYELSGDHRLLYNMAQVEVDRQHPAAALRLLALYLERGGAQIDARRRAEVAEERALLEGRAAALRVTTNVENATLSVDGAALETPPDEVIWLDPGEHRVSVEGAGYAPERQSLTLQPGARRLIAMPLRANLRSQSRAAPAAPADTADRTPLWLSLGAASASGGLAIAFVALTRAADAKLERELQRFPANEAELGAARSRLRTLSAVSDAALGVTAVTAGVSLYFALRPSAGSDPGKAPTSSIRLAPFGLGASLRGAF
jgi:PEGA domain-containing protein